MKISLNAPYTKLPNDLKTAEELTRFMIVEAFNKKYAQGMPRTESRIYGKLLDQLYDENLAEIDVDEPTYNLVKDTLDQTALAAQFSSWKWTLLEHLEKAKDT